jgi:hypothetical protein
MTAWSTAQLHDIGRTAEALEHLGRAVELSDDVRGTAESDTNLDAIRDEPAFKELVATP